MGDVVGAMRDYQKAISVNPAYALAHFNAANLYFYNSRFEQVEGWAHMGGWGGGGGSSGGVRGSATRSQASL